ncbi:MAG: DUF89 family protein [Planctomycetota bacterium]|nr:MAG: DUF89 family protein [Planctomycetota bacterium]
MAVLCQLEDPEGYQSFSWGLKDDPEDLSYWLNLFANFPKHIESQLREDGLLNKDNELRWQELCIEYEAGITTRRNNPADFGKVNTLTLCQFRQSMLGKFGFNDPYKIVKQYENAAAVRMYPDIIKVIDETTDEKRWDMLFRGLFAGNIFDMGSPKTIEMYKRGQIDFLSALEQVPSRPWFIDDTDAVRSMLESANRWRQVLFFVDNAGPDIVLGVIPPVREMARKGMRVVLAANSTAALNDITIKELNPLLEQLSGCDSVLADLIKDKLITTVDSGGDMPLIDLSRISDECNAAAADSDLIVLEGMGRGVESNWDQKFKCDVFRLAFIKDEVVAKWQGAKLFDAICRFDPVK